LEEYGIGLALENSTIGFEGYVQVLPPDAKPSITSKFPLWAIITISLVVFTAILALVIVCVKQRKRKNRSDVVESNDNVLMKTEMSGDKVSLINKSSNYSSED
jgi:heme/copper-type cytochrome/quinol oxidase subunit 2